MSHGSRPASWCGRALASWRVPWHQVSLPIGEGSDVTMCHTVSDPPPSAEGLWRRHLPHDSVCYGPQAKRKYSVNLLTRLGPPAFKACPCVPEMSDIRLIMTSSATRSRQRIKYVQDSHVWCMGRIKYVQDSDTVRQWQYNTGLLVTHNGQLQCRATRCRCASKPLQCWVPHQFDAILCMGATWWSDMTCRSSDNQQHHRLLLASEPLRYRGPTTLWPPVEP
jgi:hypothetical protein